MANENLKNALEHAGLTVEAFAEVIQVDPKSVQRWVIGDTVPYRKHRARISSALSLSEQELWPGMTAAARDDTPGADRVDGEAGAVCEVIGSWAYSDDPDIPDMVALITDSDGNIDICDARADVRLGEELLAAVLAQANAGRRVRLLTVWPAMRLGPLVGQPRIEVRMIDGGAHTIIRAGNKLLYTIELTYEGEQPGLLLLERKAGGGLFDRILDEFHADWHSIDDEDRDITTVELLELHAELDKHEHEHGDGDGAGAGSDAGWAATPNPANPTRDVNAAPPQSGVTEERRWPGRQP
ncbi:MAG: helix-turn-helix domain-containing protein [Trebonia sp.]